MVDGRIQVVARVRPYLQSDSNYSAADFLHINPAEGRVALDESKSFEFDYVLPPTCSQELLYGGCVEPLVTSFVDGYNVTIMAYGQTGSGKTYTVCGPSLLYAMNEADFGIIPRAIRHMFLKMKTYPIRRYTIHVSYLEIDHEEIRDLLSMEAVHGEITIYEHPDGSIEMVGATQRECCNIQDVMGCLETGLALRFTGPGLSSQFSSRSHALFTIHLQQDWSQEGFMIRQISKLTIVDLAGSERLSPGPSFPINSGLLALSNVTAALGDPRRKASHVTYWDSKLTCLLKESLGGNSLTLIILCLSPSSCDVEETLNSLKFGSRASNIVNGAVPNIGITPLPASPGNFWPYGTPLMPTLLNNMHTVNMSKHFMPVQPPHSFYPPFFANLAGEERGRGEGEALDENEGYETRLSRTQMVEEQVFKLKFAALQWQQLVTSAERMLNEFSARGTLAPDALHQIQTWLNMKQEAQEVIESNETAKEDNEPQTGPDDRNTLHVIEEVSEPESSVCSSASSVSSSTDVSHESDFNERLETLRQQFRKTTDMLILSIENSCDLIIAESVQAEAQLEASLPSSREHSPFPPVAHGRQGRRASVFQTGDSPGLGLPGSNGARTEEPMVKSSNKTRISPVSEESDTNSDYIDSEASISDSEDQESLCDDAVSANEHPKLLNGSLPSEETLKEEIHRLSETSESRKVKVQRTALELQRAQLTLKELRGAIRLKEAFIQDLLKSGEESEIAKQNYEAQIEKLEEEADKTRSDLRCAQERLEQLETCEQRKEEDEHLMKYRKDMVRYEKKLSRMKKFLSLAGSTSKRVEELENSLSLMREQHRELKEQLRQEAERKRKLENELDLDQKRIAILENQLEEHKRASRQSRRNSRTSRKSSQDSDMRADSQQAEWERQKKWLCEEEERVMVLRAETEKLNEDLREKCARLEQKERQVQRRTQPIPNCCEKEQQTDAQELSYSLTPSSKSTETGKRETADSDKEAMRREIRSLRQTRDALVKQRQILDERQHKGRVLETSEERRLLELDEAIEAIDAVIEYKNEIICSRTREFRSPTGDGLMTRLMNLSHPETRALLYKYFEKVVDLREGAKKLEQQLSEIEAQNEDQSRYIREIATAMQRTRLHGERRLAAQQREYEQKIAQLLHQEEPQDSSVVERRLRSLERDLHDSCRENRELRRQLRDVLAAVGMAKGNSAKVETEEARYANPTADNAHPSNGTVPAGGAMGQVAAASALEPPAVATTSAALAPQAKLSAWQGIQQKLRKPVLPQPTTTVTREKNKLIIQQQPKESKESRRPR